MNTDAVQHNSCICCNVCGRVCETHSELREENERLKQDRITDHDTAYRKHQLVEHDAQMTTQLVNLRLENERLTGEKEVWIAKYTKGQARLSAAEEMLAKQDTNLNFGTLYAEAVEKLQRAEEVVEAAKEARAVYNALPGSEDYDNRNVNWWRDMQDAIRRYEEGILRARCPVHDFKGGFCVGYCPDQIKAQRQLEHVEEK